MPSRNLPEAMIATPHASASLVGKAILREGGTAVDAAIAANAVLTVLLPDQTSVGGDCFFQVWEPDAEAPLGFNGSGRAPADASADQVRAAGYASMPRRGGWSVTVPGTVDAWVQAHERFGKLPFDRLMQPAADMAREGFVVSPRLADAIVPSTADLQQNEAAAGIFLDDWAAPQAGYQVVNPDLADTFERIGRDGREGFYAGATADAIVASVGGDYGWMTHEDLASHRGQWVSPVVSAYRDATVWELPPNSQGTTALIALAMMARESFPGAWNDPAWLHVQIEAKKRAFAIRDQYFTDPKAMTTSPSDMLSRTVIDQLWSTFTPSTATTGQASLPGDTVYLAAIDQDGLAISLIQSIYQAFGSGVVAAGAGVVLQNRGSYFSLTPGHPNELEGGKRPLHTLMPAMIDIPGRYQGPFGTQGGDTQSQIHQQLVTHLVDDGATPGEAIERPRWVSGDARLDPYGVVTEAGMPWETIEGLQQRGHQIVQVEPGWPHAGYSQMVLRNLQTGELEGAADPRAEGSVEGY